MQYVHPTDEMSTVFRHRPAVTHTHTLTHTDTVHWDNLTDLSQNFTGAKSAKFRAFTRLNHARFELKQVIRWKPKHFTQSVTCPPPRRVAPSDERQWIGHLIKTKSLIKLSPKIFLKLENFGHRYFQDHFPVLRVDVLLWWCRDSAVSSVECHSVSKTARICRSARASLIDIRLSIVMAVSRVTSSRSTFSPLGDATGHSWHIYSVHLLSKTSPAKDWHVSHPPYWIPIQNTSEFGAPRRVALSSNASLLLPSIVNQKFYSHSVLKYSTADVVFTHNACPVATDSASCMKHN